MLCLPRADLAPDVNHRPAQAAIQKVPQESPQFMRKSASGFPKGSCLQCEVATSCSAVNRRVVGSNPTREPNLSNTYRFQFSRIRTRFASVGTFVGMLFHNGAQSFALSRRCADFVAFRSGQSGQRSDALRCVLPEQSCEVSQFLFAVPHRVRIGWRRCRQTETLEFTSDFLKTLIDEREHKFDGTRTAALDQLAAEQK